MNLALNFIEYHSFIEYQIGGCQGRSTPLFCNYSHRKMIGDLKLNHIHKSRAAEMLRILSAVFWPFILHLHLAWDQTSYSKRLR